MTPSREEIERKALETFGGPRQNVKCIEELAELIVELSDGFVQTEGEGFYEIKNLAQNIKSRCKQILASDSELIIRRSNYRAVVEELADVTITTEQMKKIYGPTDEIEKQKLFRLAQTMGMMEGAEPCE